MPEKQKKDKQKLKTDESSSDSLPKKSTKWGFLAEMYKALFLEATSLAGKFNIAIDFLLFFIICLYIASSTTAIVVRIVVSIFNSEQTKLSGDNILLLIGTFLFASVLCLAYMHVTGKETEKVDSQFGESQ